MSVPYDQEEYPEQEPSPDAFTSSPAEAEQGEGVEAEPGEMPEEIPTPEENEES